MFITKKEDTIMAEFNAYMRFNGKPKKP